MDSRTIFIQLRDALVELYPKEEPARLVVHDAGMAEGAIAFSAQAQVNWHSILTEAVRTNKLDALLNVVLNSYGNNPKLLVAYGQYRRFIDQNGRIEAPPLPVTESGGASSINTAGGAYNAGSVNIKDGDFVGRDKNIYGDEVRGDKVQGNKIDGDTFKIGDISGQNIAIGRNASANMNVSSMESAAKLDPQELRSALEELWEALGAAQLPREQRRVTQAAASDAIDGAGDAKTKPAPVIENVKKIGETLKQANVAVQEGSSLWQSIQKLAKLIGPVVGGARVVAAWFGIPNL